MDRKVGTLLEDDLKDEKISPPSMATTVLSWASSESAYSEREGTFDQPSEKVVQLHNQS